MSSWSDALATLDVRVVPGEDLEAFVRKVREIVNDPAVDDVRGNARRRRRRMPPSGIHIDMFAALERAQARVFPGSITIPTGMGTGATDSKYLRPKGGAGLRHRQRVRRIRPMAETASTATTNAGSPSLRLPALSWNSCTTRVTSTWRRRPDTPVRQVPPSPEGIRKRRGLGPLPERGK